VGASSKLSGPRVCFKRVYSCVYTVLVSPRTFAEVVRPVVQAQLTKLFRVSVTPLENEVRPAIRTSRLLVVNDSTRVNDSNEIASPQFDRHRELASLRTLRCLLLILLAVGRVARSLGVQAEAP